jgi:hypothetical protein
LHSHRSGWADRSVAAGEQRANSSPSCIDRASSVQQLVELALCIADVHATVSSFRHRVH